MTVHLPNHSAVQSGQAEPVRGVPAGAGSVALLVAADASTQASVLRVAGLRPDRHYLLSGATHRFVRTDAAGEALVAILPGAFALVTLVPVI